uniref:Uncharacterized protein n=1 Tax=Pediastrum duplex TaxID=3105 RepID=A0A2U8GIP7_PEDDU|nr:hypothetical protein [Pediastrum duplex]
MRRLPSHLCFCYFSKAEGCTNAKTHFFFCSLREGGAEMNEAFASVPPLRSEQKKKLVGSAKEPAAISSHLWSRVFAQLLRLFAFASVALQFGAPRLFGAPRHSRSATEPKRDRRANAKAKPMRTDAKAPFASATRKRRSEPKEAKEAEAPKKEAEGCKRKRTEEMKK